MNRIGLVSDDRLEQEKRRRGSADYRAATGLMRDVFVKVVNESYEEQLLSIQQNVTLIWGTADTEAPFQVAVEARHLRLSAGLPVELQPVEGEGHMLPLTRPQDLRAAVEAALR